MAERRAYSEKFLMPDPFGVETATSRTSIYRAKRMRVHNPDDHLPSCDPDSADPYVEVDQHNLESWDHHNIEDLHTDNFQHDGGASVEVESDSGMDLHQILCDRSAFLEELEAQGQEELDDDDVDDTVTSCSFDSHDVANTPATVNGTSPLYEGSSLTLEASSVLVMQFKSRHNLTMDGLGDLLKLLKMHCPVPNQCLPTPYLFLKQFTKAKHHLEYHHFCSVCLTPIQPSDRANDLCKENVQQESLRLLK